jgi:prepilin-type N-terminal cleavage/methylation domain-containing protein
MIATRARTSSRGRRGFTLIEVLATLVVVSIVLPVAMRGISLAVSASSQSRRSIEAATLAETKLQDIITSGMWDAGNQTGDFSPDFPEYRWVSQSISRDETLMEVEVRVIWTSRGSDRSVGLSTFVYLGADSTDTGTTGAGGSTGMGGAGQ